MDDDLKPLTSDAIKEKINNLPGWEFKDDKIFKEYEFHTFNEGLAFMNNLASFFNEHDHHPDMTIKYKKILFELSRFSIGGKVTDRDFTVARKIEEEYQQLHS
jgi:4a-hydroxytetrahydrobiopterin dehydratase